MSATRDEIAAWVNPTAWDDQAEAQRVIDAIAESGSTSEQDWVRIAGGAVDDALAAAARDYARTAEAHDASVDRLKAAVRGAVAGGMSEAAAARTAEVSRNTVRAWIGK